MSYTVDDTVQDSAPGGDAGSCFFCGLKINNNIALVIQMIHKDQDIPLVICQSCYDRYKGDAQDVLRSLIQRWRKQP